MIRSLRWRLTLAIVLVTLAASTFVGVGLGRFTRAEFRQFLEFEAEIESVDLPPTDELVAALRGDSNESLQALLAAMSRRAGNARLLLFSVERALIGDTDPAGQVVLTEDGTLEIRRSVDVGGETREEQVTLRGGVPLGGPLSPLGTLFVLPREDLARLPPEVGFARRIGLAHLVGVLVATALALVIALVFSNRILGPVESLTIAARRLEGGDLGQRVEVRSRDEIGQLSGSFNAMAESLERQERLRRNMVSDIAHELRTPLTHLRCRIESVQDGLVEADPQLLDGLHGEIVHLSRLVDDLQELALAEAGRLQLYPVEADLAALVRQVTNSLPAASGPEVRLEIADGLRPVRIDVDRFRQVLRNLLENALRHGATGGHVVVRLLGRSEALRCEVEDDGGGIAAEHLERVFDRFHRTDPSRDRQTGGAGLGLAIARQLVLAWGGTIGVESEPRRGATFWFTVPG